MSHTAPPLIGVTWTIAGSPVVAALALALAACHTDRGRAAVTDAAVPGPASPSASTPAPVLAAATPDGDAPTAEAGPEGVCRAAFDGHVNDDALIGVVIPAYDPARHHLRDVVVGLPSSNSPFGNVGVRDCRGRLTWAAGGDEELGDGGPPSGAVTVHATMLLAPVGEPVERAVFIAVGHNAGLCRIPEGLIALERVAGNQLVVDAIGPWEGSCMSEDGNESAERVPFGQGLAILQRGGDGGEQGSHEEWERAWAVRGPELVRVGDVRVAFGDNETAPDLTLWHVMHGTLEGGPDGITVREDWSLVPAGSPNGPPRRTAKVTRVYREKDGRLAASPKGNPF